MQKSLIDAGPLIALFDRDDTYHEPIVNFLQGYEGQLITSWAVITEVLHMLDFNVAVQLDFLRWLQRDALEVVPLTKDHVSRIIDLFAKYADVPIDFADATLVVISETENVKDIITIDSDFYVYRNIKQEMLNNIFYPGMNQ